MTKQYFSILLKLPSDLLLCNSYDVQTNASLKLVDPYVN